MPKTSIPARTFVVGQRVYIKEYSSFQTAVVVDPDVPVSTYGDRKVHYVTVHHVKSDGTLRTDRTFSVLRSRTKLFTEEEYTAVKRVKDIQMLRSDLDDAIRIINRRNRFYEHAIELARLAGVHGDPKRLQAIAARLLTFFDFKQRYRYGEERPPEEAYERERVEGDARIADGVAARDHLLALNLVETVPEIPMAWGMVSLPDNDDVVDFAHSGCQHCGIIDGHTPECEATTNELHEEPTKGVAVRIDFEGSIRTIIDADPEDDEAWTLGLERAVSRNACPNVCTFFEAADITGHEIVTKNE